MAPHPHLMLGRPARLGRWPKQPGGRHSLVDLPQIVEDDLSRWLRAERLGYLWVCAEVAQEPIADSALRNRPQLLLDRLQRRTRPAGPAQVEQHREDGRKPAD